ncbi:MAG: flagellar biosynthesis protein FliQ [Chitinivibrionales bacterium]|nr:flagellar biosynthesis protein FliQ [Chitinivibrionales bacterium]
MNPTMAIEIGKDALIITLLLSGPMLIVGLVVGLVIGIFQAVTQIHEMTLTFIPKIVAMTVVLIATLPWVVIRFMDYTVNLFDKIPILIH